MKREDLCPQRLSQAFTPAPEAFRARVQGTLAALGAEGNARRRAGRPLRRALALAALAALLATGAAAAKRLGVLDFLHEFEETQDATPEQMHVQALQGEPLVLPLAQAEAVDAAWDDEGNASLCIAVTPLDTASYAFELREHVDLSGETDGWMFPDGDGFAAQPVEEWTPAGKQALLAYLEGVDVVQADGTRTMAGYVSSYRLEDGVAYYWNSIDDGEGGPAAWEALVQPDGRLHLEARVGYEVYGTGETGQGTLCFSMAPPAP